MMDDQEKPTMRVDADGLTWHKIEYEVRELSGTVHKLDTRVSVLETRIEIQDNRLQEIEREIREANLCVQRVLQVLSEHVEKENKDRIRLMTAIITTLLSVIGFAGTVVVSHFMNIL